MFNKYFLLIYISTNICINNLNNKNMNLNELGVNDFTHG